MSTAKHPEWRQLYSVFGPDVNHGQLLRYEDLTEAMQMDARTLKGRAQVLRFARELLKCRSLHLENVRNEGYRVVQPQEHGTSATRQAVIARRRLRRGLSIATHVDFEKLTPSQRTDTADVAARLGRLVESHSVTIREVRPVASRVHNPPMLPPPFEIDPAT